MVSFKNILTVLALSCALFSAQAQQNPNNLFLVDVDNVFNSSLAGKVLGMPNVGDRTLSAEEILMYQVLNCTWENGKWLRYTANPNGKGTIKVGHPFLQNGGKRVFFISNIPGGAGGYDIYYSENRNGKWSDPTNLGLKVNTPSDEMFPFVTEAGVLQIYRNSTQVNFDLSEVIGSTAQIPVYNEKTSGEVTSSDPTPVVEKPIVKPAPTPPSSNVPSASTPISGKEFRVQLGSFSNPNWTVLNQLNDLGSFKTIKTSTGLTSVHLGAYKTLGEAQELMKKVRARHGFENAYVVEVENDKVINVFK
ncbi:MAG: SPOR domain-containing protein [Chitinophagales bacterium]|nr:SPOR domain-containing protein [Chitinophagales bacterium]MCZ2393141.1 SPOR domain-containing protein [Chitinophagales bacterium]